MGFKTVLRAADKVLGTPVMEEPRKKPKKLPIAESDVAMKLASGLALLAFGIIGLSYFTADLWFDEIITLDNFITKRFDKHFQDR